MKNILLPTDFSVNSLNAVTYAMQLFKNWECTFYILNVQKQSDFILDDIMVVSANNTIYDAIAKDNEKDLHQLVSKLKNEYKDQNFKFKPLFDFDSLTAAIKQAIVTENIDLIIMGSNGATSAKEVVFGSNSLKVIRGVACPVLMIPENYSFKAIKSILFSTENCEDYNQERLGPLTQIMQMHQSSLSVLELNSVKENEKTDQDSIKHLFGNTAFNYYSVRDVPIPMAISTTIQLLKFDLHALFLEPKSVIDRLIFGSEAQDISYDTNVPLLVLHS